MTNASPNFDADPEKEPYRVLGIDPTAGPEAYTPKDQVEQRAKSLIKNNKNNMQKYAALQRALKKVQEIHPRQSGGGSWRVPLVINAQPTTIQIGEEISVDVTTSLGNPVDGAEIRVASPDSRLVGRTGSDGATSFVFGVDPGDVTVVATKTADGNVAYADGRAAVSVLKHRHRLRIEGVPTKLDSTGPVEVRVVDELGDPVPGVEVATASGMWTETSTDGAATLSIDRTGDIRITTRKQTTPRASFEPDAVTVLVT